MNKDQTTNELRKAGQTLYDLHQWIAKNTFDIETLEVVNETLLNLGILDQYLNTQHYMH